jgi:4-amino-4-deoxy-L-arabinose transferase-like glycosyltransferase
MVSIGKWLSRPAAMILLGLPVWLPVGGLVAFGRFDGLYGQDAFAYYDYAIGPLRDSLLAGRPLPPFFWPPGYPLLVALATFGVGLMPLAGQVVSLIAGGLVPIFAAVLVREVWPANDERESLVIAWIAGLLTALTGQLWQSSAVVMSDTTGLAAATLGMWAVACYGRRARPAWLLLGVGALAWAVLTRWIYGLVALPALGFALWVMARRGLPALLQHGVAAALVGGLVLSPILFSLASGTQGSFTGDLKVYSWSPLNAMRREFATIDGNLSYPLPNGLYYALAPAHRYYFTPLLALFILPGLWAVVRRRAFAPWLLLVGWAGMVYGFHAGAPWQNFRFALAYLPPLAGLAAIGWAWVIRAGAMRFLSSILIVGLAVTAFGGFQLTQSFVDRKARDLDLVHQVEALLPLRSRLLTFGITLTFQHYSRLETVELFDLSQEEAAALLADGRPAFLLLDVTNVETQWRGLPLAESYHWLRDGPGLERLREFGTYTLFEVAGL